LEKKEERRRNSMKIYMVSLFHRATIKNEIKIIGGGVWEGACPLYPREKERNITMLRIDAQRT